MTVSQAEDLAGSLQRAPLGLRGLLGAERVDLEGRWGHSPSAGWQGAAGLSKVSPTQGGLWS